MRYVIAATLALAALAAPIEMSATRLARAAADEAKTPIGPMLMLNLTAPRTMDRATAYQQGLRDSGPAPAPNPFVGEVQEDGSVKYGNMTVTVRNPCPPGTAHYEPQLPGRRSK